MACDHIWREGDVLLLTSPPQRIVHCRRCTARGVVDVVEVETPRRLELVGA